MKTCRVVKASETPMLDVAWDAAPWPEAQTLRIEWYHENSTPHRPPVEARLLYTDRGLFGAFRVKDRYVRAVRTGFMDMVCFDSCVEFFVKPGDDAGYVNFEFNCGGNLHASYIEDWTRLPEGGFARYRLFAAGDAGQVARWTDLPETVEPEIADWTTWHLRFHVPFALLESFVGPLGEVPGQTWRANFYKCGDKTSHPHWGAWSPMEVLNFHQPAAFGALVFDPA